MRSFEACRTREYNPDSEKKKDEISPEPRSKKKQPTARQVRQGNDGEELNISYSHCLLHFMWGVQIVQSNIDCQLAVVLSHQFASFCTKIVTAVFYVMGGLSIPTSSKTGTFNL